MLPVKQVVQPFVFAFLILKIGFDHLLIRPHRGDKIAPRPELLPYEVFLVVGDVLRNPDRDLPFQEAQDGGHTMFGRDRDEHVDMTGHQLPRLDHTL